MNISRVENRLKSGKKMKFVALALGAGAVFGLAALDSRAQNAVAALFSVDGTSPDAPALRLGPEFSVESSNAGPAVAFPGAFAMDTVVAGKTTKRVLVSFARNSDVPEAESLNDARVSSTLRFLGLNSC